MQNETGINEQTNNYILSPYNLFSRGLRLTTKLIYRLVLINKERKTDIKRRKRRRDAERHINFHHRFRRHIRKLHYGSLSLIRGVIPLRDS